MNRWSNLLATLALATAFHASPAAATPPSLTNVISWHDRVTFMIEADLTDYGQAHTPVRIDEVRFTDAGGAVLVRFRSVPVIDLGTSIVIANNTAPTLDEMRQIQDAVYVQFALPGELGIQVTAYGPCAQCVVDALCFCMDTPYLNTCPAGPRQGFSCSQ